MKQTSCKKTIVFLILLAIICSVIAIQQKFGELLAHPLTAKIEDKFDRNLAFLGACLAAASYLGAVRLALIGKLNQTVRIDARGRISRMLAVCATIELLIVFAGVLFLGCLLGLLADDLYVTGLCLLVVATAAMVVTHVWVAGGQIHKWATTSFEATSESQGQKRPLAGQEALLTVTIRDADGTLHQHEALLSSTPGNSVDLQKVHGGPNDS